MSDTYKAVEVFEAGRLRVMQPLPSRYEGLLRGIFGQIKIAEHGGLTPRLYAGACMRRLE